MRQGYGYHFPISKFCYIIAGKKLSKWKSDWFFFRRAVYRHPREQLC